MENRALLAFVLSLAVFILWGYFLAKIEGPPPEQTAETPRTEQQQAPLIPDSALPLPDASFQETVPAPQPGEPDLLALQKEEFVNVYNGDISYKFSSRGGVLTQVLFHKYLDDEGNPLDLINHDAGELYPLSLESGNAAIDRILQTGHYAPSTTSIEVSESRPTAELTLHLQHPSGLQVDKKFIFTHDQRLIDVEVRVNAATFASQNLEYAVLWGPRLGGASNSQTDYITFSGPTTFVNNERIESHPDDIGDGITHRGDLLWTSFQNKYFAAAMIPEQGVKSALVKKADKDTDAVYVGLNLESVQSTASASFLIFAGTKELGLLEDSGHKLVRLIDYGWLGNKFAFFVKPMLKALNYIYGKTGNYGWAIIFITILIKIILFPLTHKSFKSMKGMQKVQPYVKIIQERNKNDRTKMNEELMDLYKKHRVNPLGGCLPMLLQIPVFIALYHALFFSIELRGAPFMLWITDLSLQDPYYVTPVLMGATMFLQQKLTPTVADPVQQKIFLMMPIIFTFLFITFPSGLVIYWTTNNILTIAQQYYIYHIAKD